MVKMIDKLKNWKFNWSYVLVELLIVIIGISIAFWLNNVAAAAKANKQKEVYLSDIHNDLQKDSALLAYNIRNNQVKTERLGQGLKLIVSEAPIDSVMKYVMEIGSYDFFSPDNFTLTSLLQSGDLKLIKSEQTKRELLRLLRVYESIEVMQRNFLQALDDNYFPMLLTKVDMVAFQTIDPQFFYGLEVKNYCAYTLNETEQHIRTYKVAQEQVSKVMRLIESELRVN